MTSTYYPTALRRVQITSKTSKNINLLLTEREGRTGEYWPEVVTVRTERSEVRTKTTEGQYSPVRLEQARLVSSLLYGIVFLGEETLPVISFKKTSGAMSVDLTCLMTRAAQKRVELFITLVLKHSLFCCSKCF